MKTELFIVTHAKDFFWLKYCLRSMRKFCTGFAGVRILVPGQDLNLLQQIVDDNQLNMPVTCLGGEEWPGKGMIWHECQVMFADMWCPDADFIAHLDPDCVFTGPVTPETYIHKEKPILRYEKFSQIGQRHDGVLRWRECTQYCLGWPIEYETMRCHPEVYHRGLYLAAREEMRKRTGMPPEAYIATCRNEFPQTFCEYVTLGNVALKLFPDKYVPVEQHNDTVTPPNHLQQFWSHGAIDEPQDIWVKGQKQRVVPMKMISDLGLA